MGSGCSELNPIQIHQSAFSGILEDEGDVAPGGGFAERRGEFDPFVPTACGWDFEAGKQVTGGGARPHFERAADPAAGDPYGGTGGLGEVDRSKPQGVTVVDGTDGRAQNLGAENLVSAFRFQAGVSEADRGATRERCGRGSAGVGVGRFQNQGAKLGIIGGFEFAVEAADESGAGLAGFEAVDPADHELDLIGGE